MPGFYHEHVGAPTRRRGARATVALALVLSPGVRAGPAAAVEVDLSGYVQTDIRFVAEDPTSSLFRGHEFSRNENTLSLRGVIDVTGNVTAVAEGRVVFTGFSKARTLEGLTLREEIDPFRLELDSAFLEVRGFIFDGLDLRLGRQVVTWGTADIFNPTDNLNPDDFEDALKFGENIGNDMISLTYYAGDWRFQAVLIPIFRPAQLPPEAVVALTRPEFNPCGFTFDLEALGLDVSKVPLESKSGLPKAGIESAMGAFKVGTRLLDFDLSVSYFYGRDDVPLCLPTRVEATGVQVIPAAVESVTLTLHHPRMHALGFDVTGQLPFLGDAGIWVEGAVIFPIDRKRLQLDLYEVDGDRVSASDAELVRRLVGLPDLVLDDAPFVKLTAGMDYTFTSWLYANIQYVRGFMDDFDARRIGNYLVAGVDLKFLNDRLTVRLFDILDLGGRLSHVLYPAVMVRPYDATEFGLGGLLHFGHSDDKFGAPIVGGDEVFLQARVSF